jgi:glycosyltransferase involved in cell wall biosynthesis
VIYVCIPAHDEAATIGVLLWKTRKVLSEFGRDFRIVVHDDASTDDTSQVLQRYVRALPLTVLRSEHRVGYGRSVEKLLRHVQAEATYPKRDCAVVMQGDFTEDPQDVISLVKVIEGGSDIVAGQRTQNGRPQPAGMKVVRWAARTLLGTKLAGTRVSDPLGGMRAYRVIVLKKALRDRPEPLIRSDGWAANAEILGQLLPHARRISEVQLEPRYELRMRPSRFRPLRTLLSVARLRGSLPTPSPDAEAVT